MCAEEIGEASLEGRAAKAGVVHVLGTAGGAGAGDALRNAWRGRRGRGRGGAGCVVEQRRELPVAAELRARVAAELATLAAERATLAARGTPREGARAIGVSTWAGVGAACRVQSVGCRVQDAGFRVQGSGFRD